MKNSCEIKEKQCEVLKKRKDCWMDDGAGLVNGPMNNFSSDTGAILQIELVMVYNQLSSTFLQCCVVHFNSFLKHEAVFRSCPVPG